MSDRAAVAHSPLTQEEVTRVVLGLLLAIFLAAIDQTIVAVALVSIARDLGGFDLVPWVVSGYLVASTVSTPIYGKLSDLYGRRPLLSAAIAIYMGAALLCALAQSMPQLVAFRILQGLGGGGLIALAQATVADVAPGPERGRYQGYLSGVFAVAAVAGPVLGGYLTHYISWRAIFWIALPLAIAAFLITRRAMLRLTARGERRPIDWLGAALLAAGLTSLMVALTRIGQGHGWTAPSTLLLAGTSVLSLLACAWRERVAPEPILPPELFTNRIVVVCCAILGLIFFLLVGNSVLLPIWMQSLGGASTNEVALRMLPLTLGIPAGAFVSGRILMRIARSRPLVLAGTATTVAAAALLLFVPVESPLAAGAAMGLMGVGIGLPLPASIVAVQSAVAPRQIGIATAMSALFRTLGGAIGIAILTSVLFAQVRATRGIAPGQATGPLTDVPAEILQAGFQGAFAVGVAVAILALAVAFALPARSLRELGQPER
ncbi:MFS transporter [Burkholderiaceae bacterium FT117]|uniref:MFS transporter n=1 Tax=Zeimonas sediminis TaxID=2944268 RepID=UPI002343192A|nr:MFS transporter [Zeimonas sediminis]MCM5570213.1 MFS transporter [Zeimonas sediminis]